MRSATWVYALALLAITTTASAGELHATIRNVKPNQGKVMVAVFDSADAFQARRRCAAVALDPVGEEVVAVFSGLADGAYGIAVFQDTDGDGRFSKSAQGMPLEPYGFSRNASGAAGPPAFGAMAVPVGRGTAATSIDLTP